MRRRPIDISRYCRFVAASTLVLGVTAACARAPSNELKIEPGEQGTFLAVGVAVSAEVQGPPNQKSGGKPWSYQVKPLSAKGMSIGAATDASDGPSENSEKLFMPASITKVVTTAAVMEKFGPDFRFTTQASWGRDPDPTIGHDLLVIADGDPQSTRQDDPKGPGRAVISSLVGKIKARGVRRLTGHLLLMPRDPREGAAKAVEGTEVSDNLVCFGAMAEAFNLRRNCAELDVLGLNSARWSDHNLLFPVRVNLTAGKSRSIDVEPVIETDHTFSAFAVSGSWSAGHGGDSSFGLPVPDTKDWYARTLFEELSKQGIDTRDLRVTLNSDGINGGMSDDTVRDLTAATDTTVSVESSNLAQLIKFTNKPSDDFLAEGLFKLLATRGESAELELREAGKTDLADSIRNWLVQVGHPEFATDMLLYDGAGLSRSNRVSPRAYLGVLEAISKQKWFPVLWDSLSIAGVDGTLRGRMGGSVADGLVRGKTGTLRGAYQLAGYIPKLNAKKEVEAYVPFVILSEATADSRLRVHGFQDRLVIELTKAINPHL